MSHLGSRVSALLDGRLSPAEEERCWDHVHQCHPCRDLVEREGWVKTRLATWSFGAGAAPDDLKSSLLAPAARPWEATYGAAHARARSRSVLVLGGLAGAVGATVVGVLALGAAPASAPAVDRRAPLTDLSRPATVSWLDAPAMRLGGHVGPGHPGRTDTLPVRGDRRREKMAE